MEDYNQQYDQQYIEQPTGRKPSPAKAAIAQTKPRDNKGHFLSGQEQQAYAAQAQAQKFAQERAHVNSLLGRSNIDTQVQNPLQQPIQPQSNFQQILQANSPGRFQTNSNEKWDILLGKKRLR